MRKLILLLMAVVTFFSCTTKNEVYKIRVELDGSAGKLVKLMELVDRKYVTIDSVWVESGKIAVMSNSAEGVQTAYLGVEGNEELIRLFLENADYTVSGSLEDHTITSNSKAQNDLNHYNDLHQPINLEITRMRSVLQEAYRGDDEELKERLRNDYHALFEKQDELDSAYIADHPSSFAAVLALRGTFYMLDEKQLEATLGAMDPSLRQLDEYSYMYGKLERMKSVAVGEPYKDFGLSTPDGEILKVSDLHNGNVLLIDFWASWCGPCRRANPEMVRIYNDYHDRGFEILGVSLDRDAASWMKAISDDGLTWHHISDLKYWNSEGAELYGVPAIPHTVLIDRSGRIHAKKLEGEELRLAIESLL